MGSSGDKLDPLCNHPLEHLDVVLCGVVVGDGESLLMARYTREQHSHRQQGHQQAHQQEECRHGGRMAAHVGLGYVHIHCQNH